MKCGQGMKHYTYFSFILMFGQTNASSSSVSSSFTYPELFIHTLWHSLLAIVHFILFLRQEHFIVKHLVLNLHQNIISRCCGAMEMSVLVGEISLLETIHTILSGGIFFSVPFSNMNLLLKPETVIVCSSWFWRQGLRPHYGQAYFTTLCQRRDIQCLIKSSIVK